VASNASALIQSYRGNPTRRSRLGNGRRIERVHPLGYQGSGHFPITGLIGLLKGRQCRLDLTEPHLNTRDVEAGKQIAEAPKH